MARNTDSNVYTVIFAIAMVVVVGSLLAFTASYLKPTITQNMKTEKQQNILFAMGVNQATVSGDESDANSFVSADIAQAEFDKYITKQYYIEGTTATEDDQAYLIDIKKESDKAKSGNYTRRLPLFVGENDGKKFYIVPIRGVGLWDAIWAYIALEEDLETVKGAYFDHKAETPGLGANITEGYFRDDFQGESLFTNGEFKGITVAKGNNDPTNNDKTDNEVDAIAGATITGDGVTAMIKKDLAMYLPYFNTLKK